MANRLGYTDLSHRFAPLLHEGGRAGSGSHDPRSIGTRLLYVLKREGVVISMDGRGRAFDNIFVERLWRSVKHEDVFLKGYPIEPPVSGHRISAVSLARNPTGIR